MAQRRLGNRHYKIAVTKVIETKTRLILEPGFNLLPTYGDMLECSVLHDQTGSKTEVFDGQECIGLTALPSTPFGGFRMSNRSYDIALNQLVHADEPISQRRCSERKAKRCCLTRSRCGESVFKLSTSHLSEQAAILNSGQSQMLLQSLPSRGHGIHLSNVPLINGSHQHKATSEKSKESCQQGLIVSSPSKHHEVAPPAYEAVEPEHSPSRGDVPLHDERKQDAPSHYSGHSEPVFPSPHVISPKLRNQDQRSDSVKEAA